MKAGRVEKLTHGREEQRMMVLFFPKNQEVEDK